MAVATANPVVRPVAPAPVRPANPRRSALRRRLADQLRSSPGRLAVALAGLLVLGLLTGLAAVIGAGQRSRPGRLRTHQQWPAGRPGRAPLPSLSDADATAATAFLASGAEPPALRTRYLNDIAAASAALGQGVGR